MGHNTVLFMVECQVNHIIQLIPEMMKRDAKVAEPKLSSEDEFKEGLEKQMKKTVWGVSKCGSWYANDKGIITTIWPWTCLKYWSTTRTVDFTKYEFSY